MAADQLAAVDRRRPPLIEVERRAPLPEDEVIAALIAELIPDGATIQFGIGGTPDAVLAGLHDRRHLGVHSGILSDAFVDLVEAGVVTNERKEIDAGVSVTGALLGTTRLYDWAERNRALSMRAVDVHPRRHGARRGCAHVARHQLGRRGRPHRPDQRRVGGRPLRRLVGGQGAFARAALMSPHGRSIVALPSTARDGTISRIVARLADGIVSTARADADLVVTEHGVADLRGATLDRAHARACWPSPTPATSTRWPRRQRPADATGRLAAPTTIWARIVARSRSGRDPSQNCDGSAPSFARTRRAGAGGRRDPPSAGPRCDTPSS